MDLKNKIGFTFFILVLLLFIFGGYFTTVYVLNTDFGSSDDDTESVVELVDNRIDKTKDYIYFENLEYPIDGSLMKFQDIVINLSGFSSLESSLNSSEVEFKDSIVYTSEVDLSDDADLTFANDEGIYGFSYREYTVISYDDYVSLILQDYTYNIIDLNEPVKIECYIFDKKENILLNEDDILNMFETNMDDILESLEEVLNANSYADSSISVDDTLDNLDYVIYINKVGSLELIYLVNSTKGNYYDKLVIS